MPTEPTMPTDGPRLDSTPDVRSIRDDRADRALPHFSMPAAGARWPRRRIATATLLAPALFAGLVAVGGGWPPAPAPVWVTLVALTAAGSAATLSTFLAASGAGWRVDLGCAPCAAMPALSVLAASWLLSTAPHQWSMALTAAVVVGLGLAIRLVQAGASCST
ncbi:hypothetical protein [Promicromonospora sp. NPDC023987]|uniref:hypothetical protein n=1 Tax=Promicromonospora sp. NPDC023987 TaxID=3155360 RepID=UPI0033C6E612